MRTEYDEVKLNFTQYFDSWGEYVKHVTTVPPTYRGQLSSERQRDTGFFGTPSFDAATELARTGWAEGADRVNELATRIMHKVTSLIELPRLVYRDEGDMFDIALALEGESDCWFGTESEYSEGPGGKVTRIVFNCTVSGGLGQDVIIARGAVCLALVEALEYLGRPVELILNISDGTHSDKGVGELYVTVKDAGEPVDVRRLAFMAAHPSSFRRLGFRWIEQLPTPMVSTRCNVGYGRCCEATDKGDIYFGMGMYGERQWTNPTNAAAFLLDTLRAQGFEIE